MIRAVCFDLDDTLYDTCIEECNELVIRKMSEVYELPYASAKEAFEFGKQYTKEILGEVAAAHNRLLYIQHALEHLGVNALADSLMFYDVFWDHFLSNMVLRPGVDRVLDELHASGMKVGICTDLTAHIQHRKIRKLQFEQKIDFLVSSEEAGIEKPAGAIYDLLLRKAGTKPHEMIYAGDSLRKDVEGARAAGIHAFHYRAAQYPDFYDFYVTELMPCIRKEGVRG